MNDEITPEALEAAGWKDTGRDRFQFTNPDIVHGPEITVWRVAKQPPPFEVTVYCDDAMQNVTIGYALTMSEINAIAAVAKRTMRKE